MLPPASEIKRILAGDGPFLTIFIPKFSQYHLAIAVGSSTLIATCSRRIRFLRPAKAEPSSFVFADSVQPANINAANTRTVISNLFTIALHTILQLLSGLTEINGEGGIRTRGRDKPYTAFPRLLDKPLRHLSGAIYYWLFSIYYF